MRFALSAIAIAAIVGACSSESVVGSLAGEADAGAENDAGSADGAAPNDVPRQALDAPIGAGGGSTCVRTANSGLRCWGENGSGSLGQNDPEPSESAEPLAPASVNGVAAVASGEYAHCVLRKDGKVLCWGDMSVGDFNGQPIDHIPVMGPLSMEGLSGVAQVAVGRFFTCALQATGELRCFGLNDEGQLGIGSRDKTILPTTLAGFDGPVTSVAASMGGLFACATTQRGSVYCWGKNEHGQVGAGTASLLEPHPIDGLPKDATQVVAGAAHACARFATGEVRCWGANDLGQLGDGTKAASGPPVAPMYLTDIAVLAAGRSHTCAVRTEGTVFCWGDDAEGQVGGTPDSSRPSMVVEASYGASAVSCGLAHTCIWAKGGRVRCWGSNARSQLGPTEATF